MASKRPRRPASNSRRSGTPSPGVGAARRSRWIRVGVLVAALALGYVLFIPAKSPGPVAAAALHAGDAAGCGSVQTPAKQAPGGLHLRPGQSQPYDQHPATSGYHDPSPLPPDPHVYTGVIPETRAVHNLEHAYVLIYYRRDGPGALSPEVVARLATLARGEARVIMAPYPLLPDGTALALAA